MSHRILFYTETSSYGGAERALETVASSLTSLGAAVAALIPRDMDRIARSLESRGISTTAAPLRKKLQYPVPFVLPLADPNNGKVLRNVIRQFQPTAIVVNQPDPEEGLATALHLGNAGIPLISWLHCPQRLEDRGVRLGALRTKICSLLLKRFHGFLVPSTGLVSVLAEGFHIPRKRIVPVENGIRPLSARTRQEYLTARQRLSIPAEKIVLAFTGRIHLASKGLDQLAEALTALNESAERFVVCITGEGPDLETLRHLAEKTRSTWIFNPWTNSVRDALLPADAFVLPSRYEGLPLSALEAASLGLPLFVSNFVGASRVFPEKSLVEASLDGWCRALRAMLTHGIDQSPWWPTQHGRFDAEHAANRFLAAVTTLTQATR